jgi:hypothetical protein
VWHTGLLYEKEEAPGMNISSTKPIHLQPDQGLTFWPFSRFLSGSEDFTGGVKFWCWGLGDKATGGKTDGVMEARLPLEVVGLGGECFVGENPVAAG